MGLIEQAWLDYATQAIPSTAPAVQRRESRRAFYSGASALFTGIIKVLDEDAEPTEKDLAVMDDLSTELTAFHRSVIEGKA